MQLTQSTISVWNQALARLGQTEMVNPDDNSPGAVLCRLHYEAALDDVLRLHHFNCALARAELARLADAPVFGWSYAYALPSDYIAILSMDNPAIKYKIEGNSLLTNAEAARIIYTRRLTDESKWSPGLRQCVVLLLAARIEPRLTQSSGTGLLGELYNTALPLARAADAWENNGFVPRNGWLNPECPPEGGGWVTEGR